MPAAGQKRLHLRDDSAAHNLHHEPADRQRRALPPVLRRGVVLTPVPAHYSAELVEMTNNFASKQIENLTALTQTLDVEERGSAQVSAGDMFFQHTVTMSVAGVQDTGALLKGIADSLSSLPLAKVKECVGSIENIIKRAASLNELLVLAERQNERRKAEARLDEERTANEAVADALRVENQRLRQLLRTNPAAPGLPRADNVGLSYTTTLPRGAHGRASEPDDSDGGAGARPPAMWLPAKHGIRSAIRSEIGATIVQKESSDLSDASTLATSRYSILSADVAAEDGVSTRGSSAARPAAGSRPAGAPRTVGAARPPVPRSALQECREALEEVEAERKFLVREIRLLELLEPEEEADWTTDVGRFSRKQDLAAQVRWGSREGTEMEFEPRASARPDTRRREPGGTSFATKRRFSDFVRSDESVSEHDVQADADDDTESKILGPPGGASSHEPAIPAGAGGGRDVGNGLEENGVGTGEAASSTRDENLSPSGRGSTSNHSSPTESRYDVWDSFGYPPNPWASPDRGREGHAGPRERRGSMPTATTPDRVLVQRREAATSFQSSKSTGYLAEYATPVPIYQATYDAPPTASGPTALWSHFRNEPTLSDSYDDFDFDSFLPSPADGEEARLRDAEKSLGENLDRSRDMLDGLKRLLETGSRLVEKKTEAESASDDGMSD